MRFPLLLLTVAIGLGPSLTFAQNLSALGTVPDWSRVSAYANTITREAFLEEMREVYSIGDAYQRQFKVNEASVRIRTGDDAWMELAFRQAGEQGQAPKRYWRPRAEIIADRTADRPLGGLRIALDPGHLGGKWARMEERWYVMDDGGKAVTEGDMTLLVAQLLAPRLTALGATVLPVRGTTKPTTSRRPKDFLALAKEDLAVMGLTEPEKTYAPEAPPAERRKTLQWHQERYFYRLSEIRARARKVNQQLKPDVVLCLHFNAEAWGDPSEPAFVPRNHLHFLINGAYNMAEMAREDERHQLLMRLLQGTHAEERALAKVMATHMARVTQLPAYHYTTNNVKRPLKNPYIYARNLLANRLFECPVLYFEPYVMNCEDVYERVQAGLYEGKRLVHGLERPSIFHEYAEGVVKGLVAYYGPEGDSQTP